ncbi:hypothetical protein [Actinoplanes sp. NPDC049118]|uniref:hypothetical protein n=1 Tax=Actinoplanes sp. NPDC049118 TaxID=3155769 RepID=UPI0033C91B7C
MINRRLAIAGLTLVTALGLAGCGPNDDKARSGTGAPAAGRAAEAAADELDPAAALAAAAKRLGEQSMRIDMDMAGAISMTGVADPKAGVAEMSMDMGALGDGTKVELRKVGQDVYMKFGGSIGKSLGGGSGKPWMHVDATKITEGSSFNILPKADPAGTKAMIAAMTKVERVGEHGFKGLLDPTRMPQYNKSLKALGTKAGEMPFTAKTDDQDRLTELTLDMSALGAGAGKVKTRYSDFGTPVSVEAPPAAQVAELPKELSGLIQA